MSSTFKSRPSFDILAINFSFRGSARGSFSNSLKIPALCLDWGVLDADIIFVLNLW